MVQVYGARVVLMKGRWLRKIEIHPSTTQKVERKAKENLEKEHINTNQVRKFTSLAE